MTQALTPPVIMDQPDVPLSEQLWMNQVLKNVNQANVVIVIKDSSLNEIYTVAARNQIILIQNTSASGVVRPQLPDPKYSNIITFKNIGTNPIFIQPVGASFPEAQPFAGYNLNNQYQTVTIVGTVINGNGIWYITSKV